MLSVPWKALHRTERRALCAGAGDAGAGACGAVGGCGHSRAVPASPGACPRCADQRVSPIASVLHDVLRPAAVLGFAPQAEPTARPPRTRPLHSLPGPLRLCAVLRSMPEPPARRPPRTRPDPQSACTACPHSALFSLAARGQSRACRTLVHLLFHRSCLAPGQECKHTAANRNRSNQFLAVLLPAWAQVCGCSCHPRRTCNIEPRGMMACPRRCEAKTICVSVWMDLAAAVCRRRRARRCDFRVITLNPKSMMQSEPGIRLPG